MIAAELETYLNKDNRFRVTVECTKDAIFISGRTKNWYHKQLVLEGAKRFMALKNVMYSLDLAKVEVG